ncbi:MAG TPA: hypothetical protein VKU94_04595 [Geobacterales bacterium]|nr:hypothetical protein [Geobacterales bacterium]
MTIDDLSLIKNYIEKANKALKIGNLTKAKEIIDEANKTYEDANATINELFLALNSFSSSINVPLATMQSNLENLKQKLDSYLQEILELSEEIMAYSMLKPVSLIIETTVTSVWTGGTIDIYGNLTSNGTALAGKKISIFIDTKNVTSINTDAEGRFVFTYSLPYIYREKLEIFASYIPSGQDANVYAPAISNTLFINIQYYKPSIEITYPQVVLPSKIYTFEGYVLLNETYLDNIKVLLKFQNQTCLAQTNKGYFSCELEIPSNVQEGNYTFHVSTYPNGTIGPFSNDYMIEVKKLDLDINLNYSGITIAGLNVVIDGSVSLNNTPVSNAQILLLNYLSANSTYTDSQGRFKISVPISALYFGWDYEILIKISPALPYAKDKTVIARVYVFNGFTMASLIILTSVSSYMIYSYSRKKKPERKEEKEIVKEEPEETVVVHEKAYSGILKIYYLATSLAEKVSGIKLLKHYTIREYCNMIENKIRAFPSFLEISMLTEKHLYSGEAEDEKDIKKAEEEYRRLEEENGGL